MSQKECYFVIMPPPNITGVLHMGHVLNMTIQDVLVRTAKNKGLKTCWVPGLDHAAIATETKVIEHLKKEKNIDKNNVSRDEFLKYCVEWKEKYGNKIVEQIKSLNCLCNWEELHFTLDDDVQNLVKDVFIKMFNDGLIYRSNKIINWDPKQRTALSDEEVIYRDVESTLYYLKYKFVDRDEYLIIATSRPETIFGDVAVFVNPNDEGYKDFVGKKVRIPIVDREIKILSDNYVDKDFGTGCLKVTPAHDFNDYKLGIKYNLENINVLDENGNLNEKCGKYSGMDRFLARKKIVSELKDLNLLEKEEKYKTRIGFSERSNAIVEPKLSWQWFIKMEELAKPALKVVESEEIKFWPERFVNIYKTWMENIQDWCISRQLWWGHRIPIFYYKNKTIAAHDIEEAFDSLKLEDRNVCKNEIKQDEDVLDTWFSSAIWPKVCSKGILKLPADDLVTGPDIIFFWVARMIIMNIYLDNEIPFKNVYFTGIIRDSSGRKMSKSLGNSPDILKLIEEYSSDGVRFGILLSTQAGNDLKFEERLCKQGRNFVTKIKNAFKLLSIWKENVGKIDLKNVEKLFEKNECKNKNNIKDLLEKLEKTEKDIEEKIKKYKINEVAMMIYKLIWDDYCSTYLESQKRNEDKINVGMAIKMFEKMMILLNPFMPEVSQEMIKNINAMY